MSTLDELDRVLRESDPDSLEWNDGLGSEDARSQLSELSPPEWDELARVASERPPHWRRCVADILGPEQGTSSIKLLVALAQDEDQTVAFQAMVRVAFYCGVNSYRDGPFLDASIRNEALRAYVASVPQFESAIQSVAQGCSHHWRAVLDFLNESLAGGG